MGFGADLDSLLMLGSWAKDGNRRKLRPSNAAKILSVPSLLLYGLFFMGFLIGITQDKPETPPAAPQEAPPAATAAEPPASETPAP